MSHTHTQARRARARARAHTHTGTSRTLSRRRGGRRFWERRWERRERERIGGSGSRFPAGSVWPSHAAITDGPLPADGPSARPSGRLRLRPLRGHAWGSWSRPEAVGAGCPGGDRPSRSRHRSASIGVHRRRTASLRRPRVSHRPRRDSGTAGAGARPAPAHGDPPPCGPAAHRLPAARRGGVRARGGGAGGGGGEGARPGPYG